MPKDKDSPMTPEKAERNAAARALAKAMIVQAIENEPSASAAILAAEAASNGVLTVSGFKYRIKGEQSLYEKLVGKFKEAQAEGKSIEAATEDVWAGTWDVLRYTFLVNPSGGDSVGDVVERTINDFEAAGSTAMQVKNFYHKIQNPYAGINCQMMVTDTKAHWELQFNTTVAIGLKEDTGHAIYEVSRRHEPGRDGRIPGLYDRMSAVNKSLTDEAKFGENLPNGIRAVQDRLDAEVVPGKNSPEELAAEDASVSRAAVHAKGGNWGIARMAKTNAVAFPAVSRGNAACTAFDRGKSGKSYGGVQLYDLLRDETATSDDDLLRGRMRHKYARRYWNGSQSSQSSQSSQ